MVLTWNFFVGMHKEILYLRDKWCGKIEKKTKNTTTDTMAFLLQVDMHIEIETLSHQICSIITLM